MADKPSRGMVLYGDVLIPAIGPSHSHLHSIASKACCGFLSLPHSPPSESEEERIVREFTLLLDSYEVDADKGKENAASSPGHVFPTISERFMGLKPAIVTKNSKFAGCYSGIASTIIVIGYAVIPAFKAKNEISGYL